MNFGTTTHPLRSFKPREPSTPRPVGSLVEVRGRIVEVAQDAKVRNNPVPVSGALTTNVIEALAENNRQQYAVDAFLTEQITNPNLATAIVDPSTATRGPVTELGLFPGLAVTRQEGSRSTSTGEQRSVLIQGPPEPARRR